MDGPHERRWQCINGCATFATIGIPSRCPHCGSGELRSDGVQVIRTDRKKIINDTAKTNRIGEQDDN